MANLVELSLDRGKRQVVLVSIDQVVDLELKHSLALGVRHAMDEATGLFDTVLLLSRERRSRLQSGTALSDLLVELVSHSSVH